MAREFLSESGYDYSLFTIESAITGLLEDIDAFRAFPPTSRADVRILLALILRPFADPFWGSGKVMVGLPIVLWLVGILQYSARSP